MLESLLAIGVIGFFIWLIRPTQATASAPDSEAGVTPGPEPDNSAAVGIGTGLMGGDIEDAAIARYALSRTPKDPSSSTARDLGTALGQQSSVDS